MARYSVSRAYLAKGWGVARQDEPGQAPTVPVANPDVYVAIMRSRREAEDEADRLSGSDRYARERAEAKARRDARVTRPRDRNRYPGHCHKCGVAVGSGDGWLYRYSGANLNGNAGVKRTRQQDRFTEYEIRVRCERCGEPER